MVKLAAKSEKHPVTRGGQLRAPDGEPDGSLLYIRASGRDIQ